MAEYFEALFFHFSYRHDFFRKIPRKIKKTEYFPKDRKHRTKCRGKKVVRKQRKFKTRSIQEDLREAQTIFWERKRENA